MDLESNEIGKWIHPTFAATSMAFFLTILDKGELVSSSYYLGWCIYLYAISLVLNSIWSFIYFTSSDEEKTVQKIRSNFIGKGFDNFCWWSFIFASIFLILHGLSLAPPIKIT